MLGHIIAGLRMYYFSSRDSFWIGMIYSMPKRFSMVARAMTLDKTLKEWEIGGNGEGVDVVR